MVLEDETRRVQVALPPQLTETLRPALAESRILAVGGYEPVRITCSPSIGVTADRNNPARRQRPLLPAHRVLLLRSGVKSNAKPPRNESCSVGFEIRISGFKPSSRQAIELAEECVILQGW